MPEGWAWVRLQTVCLKEIKRGKAPKYAEKSSTLVFAQKCNTKSGLINISLARYLDETNLHKYPIELFTQYGDIIINSTGTGTLGRVGIFEQKDDIEHLPIIPDSHITTVRVFPNIVKKYMYLFLKTHQYFFESSGEGSTNQKELRPDVIKSFIVAIPPFNEQKRIVEKFETACEIINQLDAYTDNVKGTIAVVKSKILDLAIRGKLVPQNPDDEPASVLLERIRAEKEELIKQGKIKRDKKESVIFKGEDNSYYETVANNTICINENLPFDLPSGWSWCKLKSLSAPFDNSFVDGPFGSNLKTEHYTTEKEVRIIQLNNIGELVWRNTGVKYTTFEHAKTLKRCISYPGDIVIAKMMPAGRAIIIPYNIDNTFVISSDCVRLKLSEQINNKYIMYMINSSTINRNISGDVHGIGRSRTSLGKLKEIIVPIPPLSEQTLIVEAVETAFSQLDEILSSIA